MPGIRIGGQPVSLINLFRVRPGQQRDFLAVQIDQTERYRLHMPGFMSSTFHRGLGGDRVLNYAQWERAEDVDRARSSGNFAAHLDRLAAFDYSNDMHLHEIVAVSAAEPPSIAVDDAIVADVDVITTSPRHQAALISSLSAEMAQLEQATRPAALLAAILMRSLNGASVVIYRQWTGNRAGANDPGFSVAATAVDAVHDRHLYEVVSSTIRGRE